MYHRQIYKQFLSNKVLNDPRQRRFFKPKDLRDLFALGAEEDIGTETGDLFAGTSARETLVPPGGAKNDPSNESKQHGEKEEDADSTSDSDRDRSGKGDAALLRELFDDPNGAGLQSTMNHDDIVNAATTGVDIKLMDYEAERVAAKAAEELRRSRNRRLQRR